MKIFVALLTLMSLANSAVADEHSDKLDRIKSYFSHWNKSNTIQLKLDHWYKVEELLESETGFDRLMKELIANDAQLVLENVTPSGRSGDKLIYRRSRTVESAFEADILPIRDSVFGGGWFLLVPSAKILQTPSIVETRGSREYEAAKQARAAALKEYTPAQHDRPGRRLQSAMKMQAMKSAEIRKTVELKRVKARRRIAK